MSGEVKKPNEVAAIRDPLPNRPGRNVHPATPKRTRRTAQEVAAEREAQKQAIEEKIREGERAKERESTTTVCSNTQARKKMP